MARRPSVSYTQSASAPSSSGYLVECFALAAYLEENAHRQYMAMQIGDPYVFSEAEQQVFRERLATPALFGKTWDHYHSKRRTAI